MLREIPHVEQLRMDRHKRWFSDPDFDLFVWEKPGGKICRFELCYGKSMAEQAIAWKESNGLQNFRVDDGENRQMRHKMSPLLQTSGEIDYARVRQDFHRVATIIDADIVAFVQARLSSGV